MAKTPRKRKSAVSRRLVIGAGPLAAAGVGSARQPTPATSAELTLMIFSGRTDPVWTLMPAETNELRIRLRQLLPSLVPVSPPVRLGYLRIVLPDETNVRQEIIVANGTVLWSDPRLHRPLADPDRAFMAWLLATGRNRTVLGDQWFTVADLAR